MVPVTSWVDIYALVAFIALLAVARGLGPQDWRTDLRHTIYVIFWPAALVWFVWSWLHRHRS